MDKFRDQSYKMCKMSLLTRDRITRCSKVVPLASRADRNRLYARLPSAALNWEDKYVAAACGDSHGISEH